MNKFFKRTLSVLLVAVMLVSALVLPASASLEYRTGGNSVSSSYKNGRYYTNYTKLTLGNDDRNNLLAVAFSQLGYQEGPSAGSYSGTVASSGNYTEFNYNAGNWLGSYSYAWCASFVSWSLYQSRCTDQKDYKSACRFNEGNYKYIWKEYSCSAWVRQLTAAGYYKKSAARGGSYTPIYGDIIFFKNSSGPCHVGIVVYVSGSKVYTIEGNTSSGTGLEANGGGVYFKNYSLSSSNIHGYGVLPYKNTDKVSDIDYSGNNPTTGLYMTNTTKYFYKDSSLSTRYSWDIPRYRMIECVEVVSKSVLKVKYDGTVGYISNNSTDRVVQITKTASSGGSTPTPPPVTDNGSLVAGKTPKITGTTSYGGSGLTDGVYSNDLYDGTWLGLNDKNKLNDGSANKDYVHITYDLGGTYTLTDAKIHVGVNGTDGIGRPYDVQLQVSDNNADWSTAASFTLTAGNWADGTYTFDVSGIGVAGKYVRLVAINSGFFFINEIVVNGTAGGTTPPVVSESIVSGKTPTISKGTATTYPGQKYVTDGKYSANVYDGTWLGLNDANRFNDAYVGFEFDLGETYALSSAKIHIGYVNSDGIGRPWDVSIDVSDDGVNWTRVNAFDTSKVDWSVNSAAYTFTVELGGAVGKRVRVNAINSGWFFVNEFELFGEKSTGNALVNVLAGKTPIINGTTRYNGKITDGIYSNGKFDDGSWLGLNAANKAYTFDGKDYVTASFDLGERYVITDAKIYFLFDDVTGIGKPYDVQVQVSDDNENWVSIGTFDIPASLSADHCTYTLSNLLGAGRYIRFSAINSGWFFIGEVEAYGEKAPDDEPTVPPVVDEPEDKGVLGDVDGNGKIEADDYIMLKRIFFGMAKVENLEDAANASYRCDVDGNGKLEADDYILLKRVFFGMAKLG